VNQLNENTFVLLLQQGDVTAFNELYFRYHKAIYSNIYKLIRNTDVAKDILQEVFVTLWEKRKDLDPGKSVAGWLFVCSYNKSVTQLKKDLRHSLSLATGTEEIALEDTSDQSEQLGLVTEAIEKLSPQKRKVLELCKMHGKTYEETAREMHISQHTVKEYLSGALHYVRNYIRQHNENDPIHSAMSVLLFLWLSH